MPEDSKEEMNVLESCERSWHQQIAHTASGERNQWWTRYRAGQEVTGPQGSGQNWLLLHSLSFQGPLLPFIFLFLAAPRGMWDLVPCLGTEPMPPALETQVLNHRKPREVPLLYFLSVDFIQVQHTYKKLPKPKVYSLGIFRQWTQPLRSRHLISICLSLL